MIKKLLLKLLNAVEKEKDKPEAVIAKNPSTVKSLNAIEKERATQRHEPWVAVIDTNIDNDNPKHGFFELDWNSYFIEMLIAHGYGFENDPPEEIVDRWYRDLAMNILQEHEMPSNDVMGGYINVKSLTENHSEIS
jgi:hypothetical protein